MGATLPKDGGVKREELSSNEQLRKQLLGRDYKKAQAGKKDKGVVAFGSKPKPVDSKRQISPESEGEGGRSSLGKSKRKRQMEQTEEGPEVSDGEATKATRAGLGTSPPRNRGINYLDEVLAEKSRRQHKKSKKRKKHDNES